MPRTIAFLLILAAFVVAPLASSAAIITTVPTDLNVGDKYRLAFVTSTTRDATSTNIGDYNDHVTTAANSVAELIALGTTWNAIASTSTDAARFNTGTNPSSTGVPIYRLDNTRIANDNADLWDGTLLATLTTTETAGFLDTTTWTGTTSAGNPHLFAPLGGATPRFGRTILTDNFWISAADGGGNTGGRSVYAMSGVLTVIPEPSSMILVCIGATALVGWQLRRRRHRKH